MKTTQFLTNIKLWQNALLAFIFLFSFSILSQEVGDDLLASSNGMVDTSSGVTGTGGGCFTGGGT